MGEHPEANIISVSQNDGPGGWCECDRCQALEQSQGGVHSASIIHFVNRIAAAVASEHPQVAVDTLAYSYSLAPPADLAPLPNVIVRLCTGACCCHPIAQERCSQNAGLRNTIRGWFRLTRRIYIWDYVVNFRQYLLPFPNLGILGPNLRFFVSHGVRGVFEQGSGDVLNSDMAPLKAYLLAKLLWNPNYDEQRAIDEFLAAYYGPAAQPIRAYLAALQAQIDEDDGYRFHLGPFVSGTEAFYLPPELLAQATQLFNEAERLVADDPDRLLRVQAARLSLDYVKLSVAARLGALVTGDDRQLPFGDWYRQATDRFFATAARAGVTHIREASRHESTMADFRRELEAGARPPQGEGPEIE